MKDAADFTVSTAFFQGMLDATPDLIFFKDVDSVYRYVNVAFLTLFGLGADGVVGRCDGDIFPRDNAERHRQADLQVLAAGSPLTFEYEVILGERSVWLQVLKSPVRDTAGGVVGLFCTARNITARKRHEVQSRYEVDALQKDVAVKAEHLLQANQALHRQIDERLKVEAALEESLRIQELILDNSPIGITLVTERIVRRANPHFYNLFALEPGTAIGMSTEGLYPSHEAFAGFGETYYPKLGRGERVDTVRAMRRADGTDFWCRIIGQILYPGRPQAGSIWLMEDVTERRMAEEATLAAERLKREFMDNMSHEIRTPLNGIMGMAALLQATPLSAEQGELVDTLLESARTLTSLLESILDFSRLDSGEMERRHEPFSLNNIIQGAVNSFGASALQKGLSLRWTISPLVPDSVVGDGAGLRQVLAALLSNAIKFTPQGGVDVEVTCGHGCQGTADCRQADAPDLVNLSFAVRDTGIGLAADQILTIFEPFRQVDGSMTRRFGGAGLGLSIARKRAEAMGGTLVASSVEGQGSEFCFSASFDLPVG